MYPYADLLEPFYKRAFLSAAFRAGVTALKGFGTRMATGAAPAAAAAAPAAAAAAKPASWGSHALGAAAGAAGVPVFGSTAGQVAGGIGMALPGAVMGAAPGTKEGSVSLYRVKRASDAHSWGHKALHASPYVAWIASQLVADSHPTLAKALNLGAYGGYAGMSAHTALTEPAEKWTSAVDAGALLAMAAADVARLRRDKKP